MPVDPERRPSGARATRQAGAVKETLAARDGFASAQDLHADLRRIGSSVGLTTVYRRLQSLAGSGSVDVLHTRDGESVYRLCGSGKHHHHLAFRSCSHTVEVEGRAVQRWAHELAEAEGFTDVDHTVEIYGTCADCSRSATR